MKIIGRLLLLLAGLALIVGVLIPVNSGGGPIEPNITRHNFSTIVTACYAYRSEYRAWPQFSDNLELAQILYDQNPKELRFLSPDKELSGKDGIILDGWGRIIQIKDTKENIIVFRSAGEDAIFYTKDDITQETKKEPIKTTQTTHVTRPKILKINWKTEPCRLVVWSLRYAGKIE